MRQHPPALMLQGAISMNTYNKTNPPNGFYVYAYLREDNTPYYIGKGKGLRAWIKIKSRERTNCPKDKSKIVFLENNLTNVGALALESRYIRWYGRKGIDENGILLNISPGGETGNRGNTRKGQNNSKEQNEISRISALKQWKEGRGVYDAEKMKEGMLQKHGVDNIRKLRATCPHCNKEGQLVALKRWHFNNCKY